MAGPEDHRPASPLDRLVQFDSIRRKAANERRLSLQTKEDERKTQLRLLAERNAVKDLDDSLKRLEIIDALTLFNLLGKKLGRDVWIGISERTRRKTQFRVGIHDFKDVIPYEDLKEDLMSPYTYGRVLSLGMRAQDRDSVAYLCHVEAYSNRVRIDCAWEEEDQYITYHASRNDEIMWSNCKRLSFIIPYALTKRGHEERSPNMLQRYIGQRPIDIEKDKEKKNQLLVDTRDVFTKTVYKILNGNDILKLRH